MAKQFTEEDEALLAELGVEVESEKAPSHTPREERIIAGFEEIQRFVDEKGRVPQHGEEGDIFERLYAVRLERIRAQADCRALVEPLDRQGLLSDGGPETMKPPEQMDDEALLAALGVDAPADSVTELRHVRSNADKRAAEEIANREGCKDFKAFKPLFAQVQKELNSGIRVARNIRKRAGFLKADIKQGQFFVLGGQTLYVAAVGAPIKAPNGEFDARLRVIYSNATESNILLRSLQRALYKDETSRLITEPALAGPLFSAKSDAEDRPSGTIYVLRSLSDLPIVAEKREVLHKIGVTGGTIERRIANAKLDPTFLMAEVEIVASYELYNINRGKLEHLVHRIFAPARLEIEIRDRFDNPVVPREWFLVPLHAVDEAVDKIRDGSISDYIYDPASASLTLREGA